MFSNSSNVLYSSENLYYNWHCCIVPITTRSALQLGLQPVELGGIVSTRSASVSVSTASRGLALSSRFSRPSSHVTELSVGRASHITSPAALIAGAWETSTLPTTVSTALIGGVSQPSAPVLSQQQSEDLSNASGTYDMPEPETGPFEPYTFSTSPTPIFKSSGPRGPMTPIPVPIPSPGLLKSPTAFPLPSPTLSFKSGSGFGAGRVSGPGASQKQLQKQQLIGELVGGATSTPRLSSKVYPSTSTTPSASPRTRPPTPPPPPTPILGHTLVTTFERQLMEPPPPPPPPTPRSLHESETMLLLAQLNRCGHSKFIWCIECTVLMNTRTLVVTGP